MLADDRLGIIEGIISERKSVSMEDLAAELNVSKDTIRRDLIKLEEKGSIRRIFGGAAINEKKVSEISYKERKVSNDPIKQMIGRAAAELIHDHSSVVFDSSTTVEAVIPYIDGKNIHAITNSLMAANILSRINDATITILPGNLYRKHFYILGPETIEHLCDYRTDFTILGVSAINADGIYAAYELEGHVKRAMMQSSSKTIVVADDSKFETVSLFKVSDLSKIDYLVTNKKPSKELENALKKAGTLIVVAK